ncbi:unnamed protein product [Brachionus calyciflorus]|uniref:Uncharacterized protein n=1 Tax=Brachionus calyciflorus TaxID=104777 RepID=A0A814N9G8_9BILA|nr:unnamed protein product [Brachionus calyciflorus]
MTYYGASANETSFNEPDDFLNYSKDNLVDHDYNRNRRTDYNNGYVDTEVNKELQIVDPITGQTVDNLPTTVKIPTVSGDETDLLNKKLLAEKQKFLGIRKNYFYLLCAVLVFILIGGVVGVSVSAYFIVSDSESSFDWKIFGIVISSVAILVSLILLVFILVYSRIRQKKFKKALYEELNNTDSQGNPLKTATLEKMFKHSKPIKPAPAPPKPVKLTPLPPPRIEPQPIVVNQPALRSQPQKVALLQKVVQKVTRPNPVIAAPLVIPSSQAFRASPSNVQFVEVKQPGGVVPFPVTYQPAKAISSQPRQIIVKR